MQTTSGVSVRESSAEKWALAGYLIYAISTLGSQATMSIGIAFAILGQWFLFGGPIPFLKKLGALGNIPSVKRYLFWSNFLNISCLISLVGAYLFPVTYGSVSPDVKFIKDLWKCWYLYWPTLLLPGFLELAPGKFRKILDGYLFFAVLICAMGWVQYFTGWPTLRDIPGMPGRYHVQGFFGHHLSFASIMIFPYFLLLEELFLRTKEEGTVWRFLGVLVMTVALFGTFSRMLWIGLPIGLGLMLMLKLRGRNRWITMGVCAVMLGLVSQTPAIQSRIQNSMGSEERLTLWKINFEFFKRRPITGVGWHHNLPLVAGYFQENNPGETHKFVGHAHNNVIEVLASIGLIGFVAFIGWSLFVLDLGAEVSSGLFAAWIVFQINGLTQVNFWEAKVLHTMGLSLAFLLMRKVKRESTT